MPLTKGTGDQVTTIDVSKQDQTVGTSEPVIVYTSDHPTERQLKPNRKQRREIARLTKVYERQRKAGVNK